MITRETYQNNKIVYYVLHRRYCKTNRYLQHFLVANCAGYKGPYVYMGSTRKKFMEHVEYCEIHNIQNLTDLNILIIYGLDPTWIKKLYICNDDNIITMMESSDPVIRQIGIELLQSKQYEQDPM